VQCGFAEKMDKGIDDYEKSKGSSDEFIALKRKLRNEERRQEFDLDFVSKDLIIGKEFAYKTESAVILEYINDKSVVREEVRIDLKTGKVKRIKWPDATYGLSFEKYNEMLCGDVTKDYMDIWQKDIYLFGLINISLRLNGLGRLWI